ncbi:MAG: photosystem I assembly protein Ycf4 [Prochlorococcaceae cyanobacterium]
MASPGAVSSGDRAPGPGPDGDQRSDSGRDTGIARDSDTCLDQVVVGSRRLSNILVAAAVSIGGLGFLLTSASSRFGRDLLPVGHPAELVWVPQGLVMGLYGVAAVLLASYLWAVIAIDVGAGSNSFDRRSGEARIQRRGFRQAIDVRVPLRYIQAVRLDIRDGLSPRRRIALRIQGRRDLPLTGVGEPQPLAEIELAGARLARFLGVPLEGV